MTEVDFAAQESRESFENAMDGVRCREAKAAEEAAGKEDDDTE